MLFTNGGLLFYTAIIVPVQICLWNYDDPCNIFPTLPFDIVVDTFFLVDCGGGCELREISGRAVLRCVVASRLFARGRANISVLRHLRLQRW